MIRDHTHTQRNEVCLDEHLPAVLLNHFNGLDRGKGDGGGEHNIGDKPLAKPQPESDLVLKQYWYHLTGVKCTAQNKWYPRSPTILMNSVPKSPLDTSYWTE